MLKDLFCISKVFASVLVALFFIHTGNVMSQGLEKEMSLEENIPTKDPLVVKRINSSIDDAEKAFGQVDPLKIELQIQDLAFPNGGGSVAELEVRGFHNGETIFFNLIWSDSTKNEKSITHAQFRDAVGLMFPIEIVKISPETPYSPRMGDRGKPVNIWHWKADWEKELATGYAHMEDEYPNMFTDFDFNPEPKQIQNELYNSTALMSGGIAAGSLLSKANRGSSVEDLNAIGFGTLTAQTHQDVKGKGSWVDGKWNVVVYRPMKTSDEFDTQFEPGMETYFNTAVWDGEEGDRNGLKSISVRWRPLKIE